MRPVLSFFFICFISLSCFAGPLEDELMKAVSQRNIPKIRELLDSGAELSARDETGLTPVMFAIDLGYSEIVRYLILMGADYPGDEAMYQDVEIAKNSCYANCRKIETGIRMFNLLAPYCEKLDLRYDFERDEYVETEITDEIVKSIRTHVPGYQFPKCTEHGTYLLYPLKRNNHKYKYSEHLIGVYCTFHGIPDMGCRSVRQDKPVNSDIILNKYPYSFHPRYKPDTRNF